MDEIIKDVDNIEVNLFNREYEKYYKVAFAIWRNLDRIYVIRFLQNIWVSLHAIFAQKWYNNLSINQTYLFMKTSYFNLAFLQ